MLKEWAADREQARAFAEAKDQATDSKVLAEAVNVSIAGAGRAVTEEERNDLEVAVAAGIAKLDEPPSVEWLRDTFLPGISKSYVILSDDHRLTGGAAGRFFHFSWYKEGWCVRDYIGQRLLHPRGTSRSEAGLKSEKLDMTARGGLEREQGPHPLG